MRLIDLSQPLYHDCPNCPADAAVKSEVIADHATDGWRLELLTMASHTGTHIDAPLHKIEGGAAIDAIPLESFVGKAVIADLRDSDPGRSIEPDRLEQRLANHGPLDDRIVLLATGWGGLRAKTEEWLWRSPRLSPDGAAWLVGKKARGVGIDHYSIGGSREPDNAAAHEVLLSAGVWIIEDMHFPVEVFTLPQPVQFWALPINLKGHSGAFCRPVLVVE